MKVEENSMSLEGDNLFRTTELEIHVKNGTAIMSGTASSVEEVLQAENAVNSMSGVERVFNMVKTD